jgi:catechol 2,3-dioxygenase-like lactoylglutathione lyase family enzyme
MSIQLVKLHHVSRQTKKLAETRQFYMEVMGFEEVARPPFDFDGAWLFGAGIQIHLIDEPFTDPALPINTHENHIAFQVDDMDASAAVLDRHEITYHRQTTPATGAQQMFFRDPEGWLCELGCPPKKIAE